MGKETHLTAVIDGAAEQGRLQWEAPKLIFRGQARHVFDGDALKALRIDGDDLVVGNARFALGAAQAQRWAQAILNPPSLLDKLGVKPGMRTVIRNLDDVQFAAELATRAPPSQAKADLDLIFYGADSDAELDEVGALIPMLADKGAIWIVSRKGKAATVKDVEVMAACKAFGLVDNKVCAFSPTHTALRFTRRRG